MRGRLIVSVLLVAVLTLIVVGFAPQELAEAKMSKIPGLYSERDYPATVDDSSVCSYPISLIPRYSTYPYTKSYSHPSLSADGNLVARRYATQYGGPLARRYEVYDRQRDQIIYNSQGAVSLDARPSLTSDGHFMAFETYHSLIEEDTNEMRDIYIAAYGPPNSVSRISLGWQGDQLDQNSWGPPAISGNGNYIAYTSGASNIVPGDIPVGLQLYVHDRVTGSNAKVSINNEGQEANCQATNPSLSNDGQRIAYSSCADNLTANDNNDSRDIFVFDMQTLETTRVSVGTNGLEGDASSDFPMISPDGRFVVFQSDATNLVPNDTNNSTDIFVHDTETGRTSLVSVSISGTSGNNRSEYPSISAEGRFIVFQSDASDLVEDDRSRRDIFLYDRSTSRMQLISRTPDCGPIDRHAEHPFISADGSTVAFESDSENIAEGTSRYHPSIYVVDLDGIPPSLILPDYTITAIEVTQAIQDLENTVPLIAGKKTYARVRVENVGTSSNVPITAQLCLGNDCRRPDNKHGALPSGYLQIPANPDRGRLNDSFYFQLPAHWVTEGANLALTANVNPDRFSEVSFSNNTYSLAAANEVPEIRPSYPLRLRLFDTYYCLPPSLPPFCNEVRVEGKHFEAVESWLQRAYPISASDLKVDEGRFFIPPPVASKLVIIYFYIARQLDPAQYPSDLISYLMISPLPVLGFRGAEIGGQNAAMGPAGDPQDYFQAARWDDDGSYADWYAGHEIGHVLGLDHANCEDLEDIQSGVHRPEEPYGAYYRMFPSSEFPTGRIGGPGNEDTFYGFDIETLDIYGPDWTDMMGYCDWQWISDVSYKALITGIEEAADLHSETLKIDPFNGAIQVTSDDLQSLIVTGAIDPSISTATLNTAFLSDIADDLDVLPEGPYAIELVSEDSSVLLTYPFSPVELEDGDSNELLVLETVPWVQGTKQVQLVMGNTVLAAKTVTDNVPNVEVVAPNGGENLSGTFSIAWTASDADGDPLEYIVQYSADNGQSWDTVSVGITNTQSIELDTTYLPGSDNALVRVLASDGVNTGIDQSDQPFSVDHKTPEAVINSPANGAVFADGQTIGLFGDAYDVEDGYLQGNAIQWTSNVAGPLGVGQSTYPEDMPLGVHQITMTATDSDGNISTDTITITIEEAPEPPATPSQSVPGNGQSDVPVNATLSWSGGDANTGDSVTYDVYLGTTSSPPLAASGQSATTHNPPGDLLHATTYYWQIVATDSTGLVAEGPVWSFTTAGAAPTPTPTATATATSTPSPTPTTTSTPSPTPTATPTATPSPTATPPPDDQSVTVFPTADAYTNSGYPTSNYGNASTLSVKDASRDMTAYVQFDTGLSCAVITRATLRLYVTDSSNDGGDVYAVDSNWTEKALTAANAPALPAQSLASAGPVSVGQWIELDVTAGVSGSTAAFAIMNGTSDIVKYSSREGAHPPELVIEYQEQTGAAPVAAFSFSPSNPVAGQQVQFTDQSTGCPSSWSWSFGDGSTSTERNPTHNFAAGDHDVTLTVSNGSGSNDITYTVSVAEPPAGETIYLSPQKAGSVGGVSFAPADIIAHNTGSGAWSMVFDASDAGISKNVNAFAVLDDGSILLAFKANQPVSGLGTVTANDVVKYIPAADQFEWLIDGSDIGLTTSGERIDALAIDPATGDLLLSTVGTAKVPGLGGNVVSHDEDVLALDVTTPGSNTAVVASLYMDGTAVTGLKGEDINGVWVDGDTGDVYIVILGGFNLGGVGGNGRDIVRLTPSGNSYTPVEIYWDGSAEGFPVNLDSVSIAK